MSPSSASKTPERYEFYPGYYLDTLEGKRYALSCPYHPQGTYSVIPAFLLMTTEEREAAWQRNPKPLTDPHRGGTVEEWRKREDALRAQHAEAQRLKKDKSLAKLKAQHAGQRYDKKLKQWVRLPPGNNGDG